MGFWRLGRIWVATVAWVWVTVATDSDLGMGFQRLVKFLLIRVIFCCDLLLVILLGMGLLEVEAGARG